MNLRGRIAHSLLSLSRSRSLLDRSLARGPSALALYPYSCPLVACALCLLALCQSLSFYIALPLSLSLARSLPPLALSHSLAFGRAPSLDLCPCSRCSLAHCSHSFSFLANHLSSLALFLRSLSLVSFALCLGSCLSRLLILSPRSARCLSVHFCHRSISRSSSLIARSLARYLSARSLLSLARSLSRWLSLDGSVSFAVPRSLSIAGSLSLDLSRSLPLRARSISRCSLLARSVARAPSALGALISSLVLSPRSCAIVARAFSIALSLAGALVRSRSTSLALSVSLSLSLSMALSRSLCLIRSPSVALPRSICIFALCHRSLFLVGRCVS